MLVDGDRGVGESAVDDNVRGGGVALGTARRRLGRNSRPESA